MAGGLMQLVAYGAQDVYLTGNPQITFFKVVYRRHTNFAMEAIENTYSGIANYGQLFSVTINRSGDLLGQVFLEMDIGLPNSSSLIYSEGETLERQFRRFGFQLIRYVEVEIGGQLIDKHYGDWMDIWTQLTYTDQEWAKLNRMINGTIMSNDSSATNPVRKLYIPLQFWFCCNPGLYLPLIALQYHEVKLNIQFADASDITGIVGSTTQNPIIRLNASQYPIQNTQIYCDYVFLDTDERRRFAQVSHEYLITQVQFNNTINTSNQVEQIQLNFNHPCKELIWSAQPTVNSRFDYFPYNENILNDNLSKMINASANESYSLYDFTFYTNASLNYNMEPDSVRSAVLRLNGQDRFKRREGSYFRCVHPWQYHTGAQTQVKAFSMGGFYVYSFALKPEDHQPSGTCNFSRIDNAVLDLNLNYAVNYGNSQNYNYFIRIYATNYNVLRIMSGMGGLAYSN